MSLNSFLSPGTKNKFCKVDNLRNESDVEQFFVLPLLNELGYTPDYIETKATLPEHSIGKGKKMKSYKPDYICYVDKNHLKPVLIIDAKHPARSAESGVEDSQLYAAILRRRLHEPKPDQYCVGTNAFRLIVKHYDKDAVYYDLSFEDFNDGNSKFEALKSDMSRTARAKASVLIGEPFEFRKPDPAEIRGIFEACHDIIWRREKMSPAAAFFEFCKLMFIKLNEDKRLRQDLELKRLIESGKPLPKGKVIFSTYWIAQNECTEPNPVGAILFRRLRDELEYEIIDKKKKRIFERDEEIRLTPITVKEVVRLLEHYDLFGIDEDLNGRLFETFLSATMRGPELGQFFTPRSIVEFMTDMADIQVTKEHVDVVLDACCGTGGFLIEAMAKMAEKVNSPPLSIVLTGCEGDRIIQKIRDRHLFGIDVGKDPPIARIARINMYLHGDGGSRIYFADALTKTVLIEEGLEPELKAEREELKKILFEEQTKFDVVLTNPPFAMKYKASEPDQEKILRQYQLAYSVNNKGVKKLKTSLNSNVMFLERYYDLLKPGGKLLTIIDESILNTDTNRFVRDFLLKRFLVRAIISLPQWAFFEAGSNVKTSILYLVKKSEESEEQPYTFYARSENIGYDMQKPDPARSDLPHILGTWREFQQTGQVPKEEKAHWNQKSKFFIRKLDAELRRMDFEYLDPRHEEMIRRLYEVAKERRYKIETISSLCEVLTGKTADHYVSQGVPILKVRNITGEGIDWNTDYVLRSFYDANPQCHLKRDDILITSTGVGTIGRVDIFNADFSCMTDGHVSIIRVRDGSRLLPMYLLYYLRSTFGQMQMERYTVGSTGQTELNDSDIKRILVAYPESAQKQAKLVEKAFGYESAARKAREEYRANLEKSRMEFAKEIGL
ncbi:MAG: N-6 DNA methylase [Candidatus Bathyarchaeia archaeon]